MHVTILGSGTAVPDAVRFPAAHLVQAGAETLLVDAGPGVTRRLAAAGAGLESVTAVLLTHYHTDHTGGLPEILFALRNPRYAGRGPLRLVGAPGLADLLQGIRRAWPRWTEPSGFALDLREIGPGTLELDGAVVTAVPVEHTAASLAYRVRETATGAVAAFSGDADTCPGLAEVARDADLFVCEAAFPEAHRTPGHLTPRLAAEAAAAARCRTLCLTHFYPECTGHDLLAEARAAFAGEIVLAHDLLAFALPRP